MSNAANPFQASIVAANYGGQVANLPYRTGIGTGLMKSRAKI
jgi:hypothetical protein